MSRPQVVSQQLRILHLAFDNPQRPGSGGGAIRNHEIGRELAKRHQVTALTVSYPGARPRTEDGVHYIPVGLPLGYYGAILTYFMFLPLYVWTRRYDVLVEDFAAPFGSVLVPRWARGRVIGHVQWLSASEKASEYHLPFDLSERWGVRSHHQLIAVSEHVAERLRTINPAAEVVVLPNGVESGVWRVKPNKGSGDLLYLGRLEAQGKGLDLLLAAFAKIQKQTSARLMIAGDGQDWDSLHAMVRRLGLEGRVSLLGRVAGDARFQLLADAQVVCVTSRYESFGLVPLEAMACATPVVAFDIQAMREMVVRGTGLLVPAFDVDAYAQALLRLISNPELCARMGARGRRRALGYEWGAIARRQEDVYLRAVGVEAGSPALGAGGGPQLRGSGPGAAPAADVLHRKAVPIAVPLMLSRLRAALAGVAAPALVVLAAFAVRAATLTSGFEIHVDEAVYLRIADNLRNSWSLVYDLAGQHPFFLHPPLYFAFEAAYLKLLGVGGGPIHQVLSVRYLSAGFGALSAGALFLLCRQLAGSVAGWIGALVFTLEPFIVRMDSRNFLEPSAVLWILVAWLAVASLRYGHPTKRPAWALVVAGIGFAAALLTNEPTAMITLVPLWLAVGVGVLSRRRAAVVSALALVIYSIYPLGVWVSGNWADFVQQKTAGVDRFVGLTVTTGFNTPNGPSFVETVLANWTVFAPTYVLLGCGLVATAWLVFQPDAESRLVACWSASAYALQTYSVLFGTNEEQYFYYVAVMAIVATMMAGRRLLQDEYRPRPLAARARATVFAGLVLLLVLSGLVAVDHYVTSGNGQDLIARSLPAMASADPIVLLTLLLGLTSVIGLGALLVQALWKRPWRVSRRLVHRSFQVAVLVLFLLMSGDVAAVHYSTPDDGYAHLIAYMDAHVPPGTPVAATSATDAALLRMDGYQVTDMEQVTAESTSRAKIRDPHVLVAQHPAYVVVPTRLVAERYGVGSPELLTWLRANTTLVYVFRGPTDGQLELFYMPPGLR
ncbi:MAG: glycosyltransferase [Chloroflexi bacterium]|nr:MAG: glycosyltransferase [Chloroflexota bacterium]